MAIQGVSFQDQYVAADVTQQAYMAKNTKVLKSMLRNHNKILSNHILEMCRAGVSIDDQFGAADVTQQTYMDKNMLELKRMCIGQFQKAIVQKDIEFG